MDYLLSIVNDYGYLAVFTLVFLQELGIPNPVPNELVLLFAGALTTIGDLNYWLMMLIVIAADVVGTSILYFAFYFFEKSIMELLPKWLPINEQLDKIKDRILKNGKWGIFVGRLLPYLRGYVSVAAGVLNIPYKVFFPAIIIPALIWTGGYVTVGHFIGKEWKIVGDFIGQYQWLVLVALILGIAGYFYWQSRKYRKKEPEQPR
jgi:membrane protein DedA with SNARE-associated domain